MEEYKAQIICVTCNGTGITSGTDLSPSSPCPDCNQTGFEWIAEIKDLKDDINDIKDKLDDILEKLNE